MVRVHREAELWGADLAICHVLWCMRLGNTTPLSCAVVHRGRKLRPAPFAPVHREGDMSLRRVLVRKGLRNPSLRRVLWCIGVGDMSLFRMWWRKGAGEHRPYALCFAT